MWPGKCPQGPKSAEYIDFEQRCSLRTGLYYLPHMGFHRIFSITSYGEPSLDDDFFSTGEVP